jgi:hypothetical protein
VTLRASVVRANTPATKQDATSRETASKRVAGNPRMESAGRCAARGSISLCTKVSAFSRTMVRAAMGTRKRMPPTSVVRSSCTTGAPSHTSLPDYYVDR